MTFGDNVKIIKTPLTVELKLSGLTGQIYGETKPSLTGIEAIGELKDDYALNVHIDSLNKQLWFSPDLLEFIDHAPNTEIRLGKQKYIRDINGKWIEDKKPWWKIW